MKAIAVVLVLAAVTAARPPAVHATAGRCPQYETLLAREHLPVATFSRIMYRESRCRPAAVNRSSGARGLLQIMPAHAGRWHTCPGMALGTARGNIACAARLFLHSGTGPWR